MIYCVIVNVYVYLVVVVVFRLLSAQFVYFFVISTAKRLQDTIHDASSCVLRPILMDFKAE